MQNPFDGARALAVECYADVSIHNRGELIEATGPDGNYYYGEVDGIMPGMGIIWINELGGYRAAKAAETVIDPLSYEVTDRKHPNFLEYALPA